MALIVAFAVAVVVTPIAARVATRLGAVDHPGPLKVHRRPVPYFGGLAVLAAIVVPVARTHASLLVPLALAGALGLADDLGDLSPLVRLGAEVVLGVVAAWTTARHDPLQLVLGVIAVLVLVNAVNLLDGLDGLAATVGIFSATGFFVVLGGSSATFALALAGALAGFFVWNAPPARVYLGDAGSYLIGTALAMLFMATAQRDASVVSAGFLFVGVPVADTVVAVLRRLRAHQPLLRGDRGHVYDQLVDRGWPAPAAVAACAAAQAALVGIGIAITALSAGAGVAVAIATVAVVGAAAIAAFTSPRAWTP